MTFKDGWVNANWRRVVPRRSDRHDVRSQSSLDHSQSGGERSGRGLRRSLGTPLLIFYGLGVIIGAGIYVLIGSVIEAAGAAAPWSFVLAGVLACLTGLSYAELAVRFPESAGAAAYVKEAFRSDRAAQVVGLAVAAVVIVSTASIARGSIGYLQVFVDWPGMPIASAMVVFFTAVACLGVRESIGFAAAMTVLEIAGLLVIIGAGWPDRTALSLSVAELMPTLEVDIWAGILAGSFLAFFAFIGFENLASMAEEVRNPERSLPRAILASLGVSTLLYAAVAIVAVLAAPIEELATSAAPLLHIARDTPWFSTEVFAIVALVAVSNGVLIELVMLARLLYGMARRGWLPAALDVVNPRLRTPVRATLCGGAIVFALIMLVPFSSLVAATSTITLVIFTIVNIALIRLQRSAPRRTGFRVPHVIPPIAAVANIALVVAHLFS